MPRHECSQALWLESHISLCSPLSPVRRLSRILADLQHEIPRAALPPLRSEEETKEDAQQLTAAFEGIPVMTFWERDCDVDVVLRLDPTQRQSFQNVADMDGLLVIDLFVSGFPESGHRWTSMNEAAILLIPHINQFQSDGPDYSFDTDVD